MQANTLKMVFRNYVLMWIGELISVTGSGLSGFALGVWVFQLSRSVTLYSLIAFSTALPGVLLSPIIGAIVDRWDRRYAMMFSDTGASLATLALVILVFTNRLELWHIYIFTLIISVFSAFRWPAYKASVVMLVDKEQLGRANGMDQLSVALSQLLPPVTAGFLVAFIGIKGILIIDFVTYYFAIAMVFMIRIPAPEQDGIPEKTSLLQDAADGWRYLTARPGLLALMFFNGAVNFAVASASVLITPMILSIASESTLGAVLSIGGCGMLVSGLMLSLCRKPEQNLQTALFFGALFGVSLAIAGLRPSVILITIASFLVFFSLAVINASSQVVFQKKVSPHIQGRVFAVRRMITWAAPGLAYLVSGPLADRVFKPLLLPHGALANSVGRVIGIGAGRGIALLILALGLLTVMITLGVYIYPRLRNLEKEVPDVCR
ncbi:enterobactin exporter EntS [Peptococcaceae bacterium CEB3]|nr:enterobactin exporter EntS [Peptococcaceae bacterium CEB3]